MTFQTLDDLDDGQRVLVRLDLNSPVEDGTVQDNRRFDRHAETISELVDRGFEVAVLAHQAVRAVTTLFRSNSTPTSSRITSTTTWTSSTRPMAHRPFTTSRPSTAATYSF